MKKKKLILDIIRLILNIAIIVLLAIQLKNYSEEEVNE
jgi:hypothetical protein